MYHGPAHWEWIKRVRDEVDIPVVGNGAVHSPLDARAMLEQTGCDFVMIGTAAFVNPLIFRQTNELLEIGPIPPDEATCGPCWNSSVAISCLPGEMESRSLRLFLRRSCRDFLRVRAYMQRIQTGQTTLE